ncbi:uncharacterized protein [Nicotiana sylvestris]|uniref:uncharacterized protein n=1 Tax=Nicotiana sylvestris TaxID=4096 RepID=UPI00388C7446
MRRLDGQMSVKKLSTKSKNISNQSVLVPPEPGRPLFYLIVLENSFGCVLWQHDVTWKKEQAIYYLTKKFSSYEAKYTLLERICCTLTWVVQKLRHYLLADTTYLISRLDHLKYIFQKPMLTGRLEKWQILLTEFDIVYVSRMAIKAQALVDNLDENPIDDEYQPLSTYFPDEKVNSIEVMEKDCISLVRKCHQCQVHGDLIHALPSKLHHMSAPWPFVAWGVDVIRPIEPRASNGHRFILVSIDDFTKWVKTVTFKAVTKKAVVDFVHSNIICRFGIPKTIITDNAANLNIHLMREVCEQFQIMHRNSTPYWPKANGVLEAANKNIKKILRKMNQGSRKWHKKLPFALLGYRTTVRILVGATPYLLFYGTEAVIPTEVEIPSLRIIVEVEIEDSEWVKTYLEQLTLIDEKQMDAIFQG